MTMNNQSPLIPQGSLMEQRNKGRARVKIAVFLVLAIHGIGLMALLMQGCKKDSDTGLSGTGATTPEPTNNPTPAFVEPTNAPAAQTNVVAAPTNNTPTPLPVEQPQPVLTATSPTDYVIAKGDTFSTVAKKFHVSVKALLDANPAVEPTKLKIGQSIHIPASAVAAAPTIGSGANATPDATGTGQTYSVKSGDSLTKIAGQFGVTVKALRSANHLKTDKIVVGQKLNIPGKPPAQTASSTTSAPPVGAGQ
jgi:LysM repeat protein